MGEKENRPRGDAEREDKIEWERDAAIGRRGGSGKHRQEADVKSLATNAVCRREIVSLSASLLISLLTYRSFSVFIRVFYHEITHDDETE